LLSTRLKNRRIEIGMSIKELSEKTGLTSGFISQIEHGLAEPSITSLRNMANVLDVAVFYFLLDDINVNPVVKKEERKILHFSKPNLTYELLSPDLNRQMEMFMAKLKPGESTSDEQEFHAGEEAIHVLHGNLRIQLGDNDYTLNEGDTIHFDSSKPHKIINDGQVELEYISAATPPPENDSIRRKGPKKDQSL
jgi:transcriptional regulator with XRE-family HTH domain